ncbi:hypothetical protein B0H16DRAFT_1517304 [Mycena metata]|uniref:Uncharacterized protein n=1 Tax=Mycena metata TaxID=1033252 RepID=A0AAD7JTT4_9AGAR|nr:hypothetical protein B0H16DRAFT_1517304 [Mycena metata]
MAKIRDIFGGEVHLFHVLNEAQAPAASFPSAFCTGGQLHPILPEILRAWQAHTVDSFEVSFVISATRIPKEMFDYEGNKSSRHRWTSNTGGFDQSTQRRYIESFLPPSIMRARHRFTSGPVTMLLLNGFLPADPILDDYFCNFASIQPCDSDTDMYWITSVLKTVSDGRFTTMDFSLLALHSSIKENIRTVLFRYLMTDNHPPPFGHDGIEMVTNGFGRFIGAETNQVRVDEPLILVGAANWLLGCSKGDDPPSYTYYSILQRDPPNGETLAKCVAYYLTLLTKKRPLREISSFPADSCPKWANQNARLVTLHATPTGVDIFSRNFTTLATVTDSMAETVSWLQHEKPTPFCLPRTSSPDLIFILRLENGDLIWVFLRVAVTKDSYLNESVLKSMLLGLQDDNLLGEEANQQLRDNAKDALKGLPNLSSHLGRFGVLRVIASFPGHPRIGRLPTARRSHAASLNMGLFGTIHQSIPAIDMVNTLAASRKYDSDDGEQRKKAKRPRSHAPEPKKIVTRSTTKKR